MGREKERGIEREREITIQQDPNHAIHPIWGTKYMSEATLHLPGPSELPELPLMIPTTPPEAEELSH